MQVNDLLSTDASHLIFCYMEYKGGGKYDIAAILGNSHDLRRLLPCTLVGNLFSGKFQRWFVRDIPTEISSFSTPASLTV